jgi:hypothetical protein
VKPIAKANAALIEKYISLDTCVRKEESEMNTSSWEKEN